MKNPTGVEIGTEIPVLLKAVVAGETDDSLIVKLPVVGGGTFELRIDKNSPQFMVRDDLPVEFKTRADEIDRA